MSQKRDEPTFKEEENHEAQCLAEASRSLLLFSIESPQTLAQSVVLFSDLLHFSINLIKPSLETGARKG